MAAGGQRRASAGGFFRIELLVAVTILLLLAGVLLERFLYYQELAAKAQLESTVNLLRMALRLRQAEMIMAGEEGRLARLETENPFSWFDREPTDYVGECSGRIQGWCYDAPHQELVYRPGYAPHLAVAGGDDCIRLRVRYRNHADGVTKFPPVVTLTLVASIDWFGMQRPAGAW